MEYLQVWLLEQFACCAAARAQLYVNATRIDRKIESPTIGETACRKRHVP